MASNTVRRDKLKRDVEKGLYLVKCNYHYSDDPRYDFHGDAEYKEAALGSEKSTKNPYDPNKKYLREDYFEGYGRAWKNADGTVTLCVHSNLSYDLKKKEA